MVIPKSISRCFAVGALITLTGAASAGNEPGILGKPAPKWSVDKWSNLAPGKQKLDVQDFRGKALYLFCFQSWCPGCHRYGFPTLQKVMSRFKENDDVAFVAIQTVFEGFESNTFDRAKQAARKYKLRIPVGQSGARGEPPELMARYRTGGTPWVIIIDRDGMVRYNDFHIRVDEAERLIRALLDNPTTKDGTTDRSSVPRSE